MKTYNKLTAQQRAAALEHAKTQILTDIIEGSIRFDDTKNGDNLQARIDTAWAKAEKMQTPWFVHEYIMDTCSDDIASLATPIAEDALYSQRGETVIDGILV